jgi:hypothetical protein
MDRVFEVDSGLSFSMILVGGCFVMHPLFGLVMTFKFDRVDAFSGGVFVGFSILNAVNALASTVFWMTKVKMAVDLVSSIPDRVSDPLSVNPDSAPLFRKLSAASGLYFGLEVLLIALLVHSNSSTPFSPVEVGLLSKGDTSGLFYSSHSVGAGERASLVQSKNYQNPFRDDDEDEPSVSI